MYRFILHGKDLPWETLEEENEQKVKNMRDLEKATEENKKEEGSGDSSDSSTPSDE